VNFGFFLAASKTAKQSSNSPPALTPLQIHRWLLIHCLIVCGARELLPVVQILEAAENVCSTAAELLAQARQSLARDERTGNNAD
jgi:hypothetical protein